MKHSDEKADKKLISSMLKKALKPMRSKSKKVKSHLKEDIKEAKHGIRRDKKLMKSLKYKKGK